MGKKQKHIGEELDKIIRNSGVSKSELTRLMGIHRTSIDKILQKEKVPLKYVARIGKILGLDLTGLVPDLKEYSDTFADLVKPKVEEDLVPYQNSGLAKCIEEKHSIQKKYTEALERENEMYRGVILEIFGALNLKPGPGVNLDRLRGMQG